MEKKILFRGKDVETGEWVYGSFIPDALESSHKDMVSWGFIKTNATENIKGRYFEIERSTLGQYIGFKDGNGYDIFEGDILNCCGGAYCFGTYEFSKKNIIYDIRRLDCGDFFNADIVFIIGNIHDNKELIEDYEKAVQELAETLDI